MPGHAGSPYWAAVDFDDEDDAPSPSSSHRVYLDPWDNEAYGAASVPPDPTESSQGENFNSFAGEPVSASFYYVPTKNYDSGEEPPLPPPRRNITPPEVLAPEYLPYGRKLSRPMVPDYIDAPIYGDRSMFVEDPVYMPHPMMYEPLYGMMPVPPFLPPPPPPPRGRMSLQHHPEYMMNNGYGKSRRNSRLTDAYEHFAYESMSPDYEDWARPFPKTAPDNFHLSRYGHLQIDYSCSWNSLDRLIRNQ